MTGWLKTTILKKFARARRGSFALNAAILAPFLLAAAAGAIDFSVYNKQKSTMQAAADAAAIAAVREATLKGWTATIAHSVAESVVDSNYFDPKAPKRFHKVITIPDEANRKITVKVQQDHYPYFASSIFPSPQMEVSATAVASSTSKVCVLGLMEPQKLAKSSIHLDAKAKINASDCSVISNSAHKFGMRIDGGSSLTANFICSAGGVLRWWGTTITPRPVTNCPQLADPLALRPQPSVGSCSYSDAEYSSTRTLSPGVYCGGLTIEEDAKIKLSPGLYIIKDGPLVVKDSASLTGTGVSFFLTGEDSTFEMTEHTTISLSAMETGEMAGILFSEDKNVDYSFDFNPLKLSDFDDDVRVHRISSNDARTLLGTFYLPRSIFMIDAGAPVADTSAYTAIVTGRLWVREGPTLVLNADYSATSVPVPNGLGPNSAIKLLH